MAAIAFIICRFMGFDRPPDGLCRPTSVLGLIVATLKLLNCGLALTPLGLAGFQPEEGVPWSYTPESMPLPEPIRRARPASVSWPSCARCAMAASSFAVVSFCGGSSSIAIIGVLTILAQLPPPARLSSRGPLARGERPIGVSDDLGRDSGCVVFSCKSSRLLPEYGRDSPRSVPGAEVRLFFIRLRWAASAADTSALPE